MIVGAVFSLGLRLEGENQVAKKLFRLAGGTVALADTSYFYSLTADLTVSSGTSYSLTATDWIGGSGTAVSTFATGTNGYYNLCINGVLQQTGIYTVQASRVKLVASGTDLVIPDSAPITLQSNTYTPTTVAVR